MSRTDLMSARQVRGLNRLGDWFLPGGAGLPSFSESGAALEVDHVVRHLPDSDRKDLGLLLGILGLFPAFFTSLFMALVNRSGRMPGPVGALLRFARVGTRGLVMSLYWERPDVLSAIGYDVAVYTEDLQTAAADS